MKTNNKSFTLIELLVVIVIIGILAGVIMISTSSSIDKANFAKAQAFSNTVETELISNLISEWKLDNDLTDSWEKNNGIWEGIGGSNTSANFLPKSECISGRCLDFDGYDDNVTIPHDISKSLDELTLSFWIKVGNLNTSSENNYRRLFHPTSGSAPFSIYLEQYRAFNFRVSVNGVTYYYIGDIYSEETLPIGKWAFLTYIYTQDGYGKAYKDGKLSRSGKMKSWDRASECPGGKLTKAPSSNFRISYPAGTYTPNGDGALLGVLDEIAIYNAPLSASQIKQNYIAGLNSMLSNGNISNEEYNERINELAYDK